jgi:hypothetical protein
VVMLKDSQSESVIYRHYIILAEIPGVARDSIRN